MDDIISKRSAHERLIIAKTLLETVLQDMPTAEPKWIPVKFRPMDSEEREYWEEHFGELAGEDSVMFDCPMPDDGQEVWVCYKGGIVSEDVCESDGFSCGLEGNGDWSDIVAWMPRIKPDPWKGDGE